MRLRAPDLTIIAVDGQLRFALIVGALHTGMLLLVWGVTSAMMKRDLFPERRVGGGKAPDAELSKRAMVEVLTGQVIFVGLVYVLVYPAWVAMGGAFTPWQSLFQAAWHILVFILCEDTIFYWAHRGLHVRFMFSHVHARHHRFRHVRGFVAEYAHPLENTMNFIAFFAGPVLLGSPFWTVALWIVIRTFETVDAHSGYAFTSSASRHAFHHLHAQRGCYGSFFSPWDRLMGTDKQWRDQRAQHGVSVK